MQTVDQRIYNMLLQEQQNNPPESRPIEYGSTFIIHVLFKVIPVLLMWFRNFFASLFGKIVLIQLILLFVVLDFWLTKNVTGKKMLGLRWAFEQNENGDQKFQYEGRVNQQYVSSLNSKLFWLVLVIYVAIPIVFLVFGILSLNSYNRTKLEDILLYLAIFAGGACNLFFFWRASQGVSYKRNEMTSKLGNDFVGRMGGATIVSYA